MSSNIERPKVSIIIPVFNAGARLERCIDTIVNQTLTDIEIIIVLDCPTDGSDLRVMEYASKDSRIKVIRNESNLHIGLSRNVGLSIATGDYVCFSDDDDYREYDMYSVLYDNIRKENYDVVFGTYVREDGNKQTLYDHKRWIGLSAREVAMNMLCYGFGSPEVMSITHIHSCIYKTSFLKSNAISFVDTKSIIPEDYIFQLEVLLYCSNFSYDENPFYIHRIYDGNESVNYSRRTDLRRLKSVDYIYSILQGKGLYDVFSESFVKYAGKVIMSSLISSFFDLRTALEIRTIKRIVRFSPYYHFVFDSYKPDSLFKKVLVVYLDKI